MANDNDDHGQPSTSTASTTTNQRKIKKHLPLVNRSTSEIVRTYQKRFDSTIDDYNDDDDNHNHNNDKRKQQQHSFDETFIIDDNVDGKMINNNNRIKTNRPPNSRWKQQRLPAWQPILKPTSVLISFILFGLFCIVIGVVMFISNQKIQEIIIDYTDCHRINPITNINQCEYCRDRWKFKWENCECLLNFTITESIDGPLFLYYSLNGFYQNHRRYVASLDRRQLMGEKRSLEQIRSDCYPYSDIDGKIIAPCGAIANSMFSDTFQLRRIVQNNHDDQPEKIHIWEKDISWPTDRQNLYQNPSDDNFQSYAKPINWSQNLYDDTILNKKNEAGFGYINEHFMVWMRPAAFPIFRKLWGRIDCRSLNNNNNIDQLPKGSYQLLINYDYQTVTDHLRITKKVIISNMSWMGGKNSFLSILYMVVGIILILIAIIFIIIFPKIKSNDNIDICQQHNHQNLPTNSEQNQQQEPEIKNHFQYYHSTSQS